MKGTEHFKNTIKAYLDQAAADDPQFAESLNKEGKTLDGCINYILNQVKKIGAVGYTDDEIYGMATHYYDEDDLEKCDPIEMGVVVNHKPELTAQEKEELRKQARNEILDEERKRLRGNKPSQAPAPAKAEPKPDPTPTTTEQASLF